MNNRFHPAAAALHSLGALTPPPTQAELHAQSVARQALLDSTADSAGAYAANGIREAAVAMVLEWAATGPSDLDDGESLADRLEALAIGIADEGKDGEISDDEADVIELALNAMADYMVTRGVAEEDAVALLVDKDGDAAGRVHELLAEGEGADDAAVDGFLFDAESSEAVLDSILDAVYKKKTVVRKGKKMRVNKRVSGTVRLNAKQKLAIRKASLKSNSAKAKMRRLKSMKIRRNAGL